MSAAILRGGSDGPLLAVLFASVALVAATVLPPIDTLVPDRARTRVLLILAVSAVVLCWTVLAVGFAVHYVRLDVRRPTPRRLHFPGTDSPAVRRLPLLRVSVTTMFGTTDVNVTDRAVRRTIGRAGRAGLRVQHGDPGSGPRRIESMRRREGGTRASGCRPLDERAVIRSG